MDNISETWKKMERLIPRATKYAEIHCQYGNANAWRTCLLLEERIFEVEMVLRAYHAELLQCLSYHDILNGLVFDNPDEETEFEKKTFEVQKIHNTIKKETLDYLRSLQGITNAGCDNISSVEEMCIEFVDLIDEFIDKLDLEK